MDHFPWNLRSKWPTTTRFQRAIDEPCILPLTPPKGGTKRYFAIFSSKFQLLSKKVCYKVSLCEIFQRQSCSYIIPLFNGHIDGLRASFPSTKYSRSKWPTPSENANFDRFRLIVPQLQELARKIQLALIGSRQRDCQRAVDEPCTLSLTPPNGGTTRDFAFLFQ